MDINAKTNLLCLIGNPVEHSFSPSIHNYLIKKSNLNMKYVCFNVKSDELENAIKGIKALGIKGCNVTIPHKVGEKFDYYIKLAGGLQKEADKSKIYVLQPNGVSLRRKNGMQIPILPFMPFERNDILPGATLVVPRKARPLDSLALVETITPVLANLSVTAASIAAISDN